MRFQYSKKTGVYAALGSALEGVRLPHGIESPGTVLAEKEHAVLIGRNDPITPPLWAIGSKEELEAYIAERMRISSHRNFMFWKRALSLLEKQ